jgi:hypothetical protein
VTDPRGFIREWLEQHGRLLAEEEFAGESYMRVQCYLTAQEPEYDVEPRYHSLDLDLVETLKLAGYSAQPMVRAGDQLAVTLQWEKGDKESDYGVRLGLAAKGAGPEDWIEVAVSTVSTLDVTSPSQVLALDIPPGTPPLEYSLAIYLFDAPEGRDPDPLMSGLEIGTIRVVKPLVPLPTPPLPHEAWANFGDLLQLEGYDLPMLEVKPGGTVDLELFWRAWGVPLPLIGTEMELRDRQGLGMTSEAVCLADRYPSSLWEREELVRDLCRIEIPAGMSSGTYTLTVASQALEADGKREVIPFWSDAGIWEETLDLGMVKVIRP